ncbi:VOC family protein [Motiliproteus sp.]|uniref:VOC family protein n=1 Tax=Motiliproteus sp. TaxID=1898955 RepID=UPI003BAB2BFA
MKLKTMIPMLNISHIETSLAFYQTALGFEVVSDPNAISEWRWATIRSGDVELMLSQTSYLLNLTRPVDPQQSTCWPTIFYFYPDDVQALHRRLLGLGYQPTELIETIYGMREFSLQDPDGHMLSFGESL